MIITPLRTAYDRILNAALDHAQARSTPPRRRVVYTCLFGFSERFLDLHLDRDDQTDFVCFTDDADLRSDFWTIVQAPRSLLDPHRRSKGFKHRPHLFFPEHAQSLYLDNTVQLAQSPAAFFDLLDASDAPIRMFRHPFRTCVYQEAEEVKRVRYDLTDTVDQQMAFYRSLEYPQEMGLNATTVMARRHHEPKLAAAMNDWHDQVLRYSKRDQLSFDVVRHFHGLAVEQFEGTLTENNLIVWPAAPAQQRLPRDFEDEDYLKLHPDVAAAGVNPRRHFLEYGMAEGRAYRRPDCPGANERPTIYVDAQDERGRELLSNDGHLNLPTFDIWTRLLSEHPWTHVVDVGANYGEMLLEAPLPKGAKVLAFEPNPRIFPLLVRSLTKAGVECDCRLLALSDEDGFAELSIDLRWSGLTRLICDGDEVDPDKLQYRVPTTTLSTVLAEDALASAGGALLVKIDVEGAEIRVLKGLGDASRFASFAALVEILHLAPADIQWLLDNFEVELLDRKQNVLVKVKQSTPEGLDSLIRESGYYANDVVVRTKAAAV